MNNKKIVEFLSFFVANSVVLVVFSLILANNVVLGSANVNKFVAAFVAGLLITAFDYIVVEVVSRSGQKIKDEKAWTGIFFVTNVLVLWFIKRLAELTGVGISNNFFLLLVALGITLAQWQLGKYLTSKK